MKKITLSYLMYTLLFVSTALYGQVGVGTSAPNALLDVSSTAYGFVYPSVALTSTIVQAPVVNPNGGNLEVGTTVVNTNTTNTGTNDVDVGIYSWDGTQWITHFFKRQNELFEQTSAIRTTSNGGFVDIPGFPTTGSVQQFTAEYSGVYKIEAKTNFGAGELSSNGDVNAAMVEGTFRFIFGANTYTFTTKAFSAYNDNINSGTSYDNIWKESYITKYVTLVAGTTYDFSLEFDQGSASGFVSNGNNGDGRGYVGEDVPCFIEITYIDE